MTTPDTSTRHAIVPCASCGKLNRVDVARADGRAVCGACQASLSLDAPVLLTDATFDAVIGKSTVPVLVDFYADWCGPCRSMAPVFAEFARRNRGRVLVAKVDTDASPGVSGRFGIRSIPTLTLMHGGREVARQVGAVPMAALEKMIAGFVA
jgi:thioredoxin 2